MKRIKLRTIASCGLVAVTIPLLNACGGSSSKEETPQPPTPAVDTRAPVIELSGGSAIMHEQGHDFLDPGASAIDETDGDVTISVSGTVGVAPGDYTLTYTATDAAGNTSSITRVVTVADTTMPVITLTGAASIEIAHDQTFVDPGASATDNINGDLSVTITGTVGRDAGEYVLTYTAADAAGNQVAITRTVTVLAAPSEVIPPPASGDDYQVLSAGLVDAKWDAGIKAFDSVLDWSDCGFSGGTPCESISWQVVDDAIRGQVLSVKHSASGDMAGLFVAATDGLDLTDYRSGDLEFDIKVVSGDSNITVKLDCHFPCTSGEKQIGSIGANGWQSVTLPVADFIASGLDIRKVNTGIVIWATNHTDTEFLLDNVRFTGFVEGGGEVVRPPVNVNYTLMHYGAGNVSDTINPASYRCVNDYGSWIYNAGVVEPGIAACDSNTGIPTGTPTPITPQLTGAAKDKPTPTHKWWGSIPFMGEMRVGDANTASYITPDPLMARVTERGVRLMGIPSGLSVLGNEFGYRIPDPFEEVFDGVAIANSAHSNMDAMLKDYSDGSVTVAWFSGNTEVMEATFVHGSPYVYFKSFDGDIVLKTLRPDGGEKGIFYQQDNSLGVWTSVAGSTNYYLLTGEGETQFTNIEGNEIIIANSAKELTLSYLPTQATPADAMVQFFERHARNVVATVNIGYDVNRDNNEVTVSHQYLDTNGLPVTTVTGMHPLHWKHAQQVTSAYQTRSARGIIKYVEQSGFDYQIPYIGVLPSLPTIDQSFDNASLTALVDDFIAQGEGNWNTHTDTYWAGKNYGKVAELIAIADQVGLTAQATQLRNWLKAELEDWFTAETDAQLDQVKYFVYDDTWNTLLGLEESFMSHQMLNDHHFHYGYFVRAAAEICRVDPLWCGDDQFGPMVDLLIRDYAGSKDDEMFPYLRNFDPANGFSWASGKLNFARGNNNESTSEAANAYGAIVLYGMIKGDQELVEKGMYMHASTTATYWQYWNDIDGYKTNDAEMRNFPAGYDKITTSIIWGDGGVFSTWFSGAPAHILGIQGLPINSLVFHVGLYEEYMKDYVTLGLTDSSNGKPSGLVEDHWRDIWWNLWALNDAPAALADYQSMAHYNPEAGETKAHTYHWLHTMNQLGHVKAYDVSADHPAAVVFSKNGVKTYVIYNYTNDNLVVKFSDGHSVTANPNGFTVESK
ncbi:glycosyl hydrolase [Thalassotalea aquiviva]|uniref:glycosyl hydrolase n=1 Tax=Thalassotalea aquiviva TaxID=3242415 RepID=UPI00352A4FCF